MRRGRVIGRMESIGREVKVRACAERKRKKMRWGWEWVSIAWLMQFHHPPVCPPRHYPPAILQPLSQWYVFLLSLMSAQPLVLEKSARYRRIMGG